MQKILDIKEKSFTLHKLCGNIISVQHVRSFPAIRLEDDRGDSCWSQRTCEAAIEYERR